MKKVSPGAPKQQQVLFIFKELRPKLPPTKAPAIVVLSTEQSFSRQNNNHTLKSDSNSRSENLDKRGETVDETSQNKGTNFPCELCPQSFKHEKTLAHHCEIDHPSKSLSSLESSGNISKVFDFSCQLCGKNFSKKHHYLFHQRTVHNIFVGSRQFKPMPCAYCKNPIERKSFIEHLAFVHNKSVETDELKFSSFDQFIQWKEDIEKKTRSKFVAERGFVKIGTKKLQNYSCHRSGLYFCKGKGIRRLKLQGSCKMNKFCPAGMKVTIKQEGDCDVSFCKTHIGHMNDIGHYNLTSDEKLTLAIKIAAEISVDDILDEVRDSVTDSKSVRTHLLTEQDLDDINHDLYTDVTHKESVPISLETWVSQMQSSENCCILFFKPMGTVCTEHPALQNDDFFLALMNDAQTEILQKYGSHCICVDNTCAIGADGYGLVTMLVKDNLRQAYPCAFLVSNKCDEAALKVFYSTVFKKCGKLSPRIFMSDVAEPFYDAWADFHSLPEKRLYCSWLVDDAWRLNLHKIDDKEKQVWAYKMLSVLLEELDKEALERMLGQCVCLLTRDADTVEFGEYISEQFATCKNSWSYCYRVYDELNANVHLERMHRTIKHICQLGEKVKHLDISITAIMKYIRLKLTIGPIETDKEKLANRLKNLKKQHEACREISRHVVESKEGWVVTSDQGVEFYIIKKNNVPCNCPLICNKCDVCVHKYACNCPDYTIQWNICEHIHSICVKKEEKPVQETEDSSSINDNDMSFAISDESSELQAVVEKSTKDTHCQSLTSASIIERRYLLTQKVSSWIESLSTPEEFEAFEKIIAPIPSTLAALQSVEQKTEPIRNLSRKPLHNENDSLCCTKRVRTSTNKITKKTARKSISIPRKPIQCFKLV